MHQHILSGRLGRQPELRFTQATGASVCNLALAHDRWTKDADDEWVKAGTQWYDVTVWGEMAERCSAYAKGTKLIVRLRDDLKPRIYRRNDGTIGVALEVTANTVEAMQERQTKDDAVSAEPAVEAYEPQEYELEPAA
jgi:single-strand DNA-binding protein